MQRPVCRCIYVCTYICGYKYIHVHTNMIYDLCYQIFEGIHMKRPENYPLLPTIARRMPANALRIIERALYSRKKSPIHLLHRNPHFCKRALSPQKNPTFPPEESWELATIAPLVPAVSACDEHLVGYTHINIRSDISKYHIIGTHTTFYQKHTCSVDDAICCYTYNIYTHIRNDISKYQNISFAYVRVCVCMYAWSMYVYTHT